MRAKFVVGEVAQGLRRNLTMTLAVIITVAVSLALFGAGLLVRNQVELMKGYWYDKVEVSIFLCGETSSAISCASGPITESQREEIRTDLEAMKPLVKEIFYESSAEAFDQFKERFKGSPILDNVTAEQMPESFRVKLSDPKQYSVVASAFQGRNGVDSVADQRAILDKLFSILGGFQKGALIIAGLMLFATVLLVVNTIRVAAFSRRRETGIMRLVGASNFYIQLPFLLEAAIAAALGGAFAVVLLAAMKRFLIDGILAPKYQFTAFVNWQDVAIVSAVCMGTGITLAAIAAFFTLRRYLKV